MDSNLPHLARTPRLGGQIDFSSYTVSERILGLPPAENSSKPAFSGPGKKHELMETWPSLAKTSMEVRSIMSRKVIWPFAVFTFASRPRQVSALFSAE